MIITCVSHGRTVRDAENLSRHLAKSVGQTTCLAASSGLTPSLPLAALLQDLRRFKELSSRATTGFQHITINPGIRWNSEQRDEAVSRILEELGAADHAWLLVEHVGKKRAAPGGDDCHWHLVIGHVGPTGRGLDTRSSFARLEAVARTCEFDFGEQITISRRPAAVAHQLRRMGRPDVIAAVATASNPTARPRSGMSSAGRHRAARLGVDLPAVRATIKAAWAASGDLATTLESSGLWTVAGEKRCVVVVKTHAGDIVGALDRLAGVSWAEMWRRLEAEMAKRKKENTTNEREAQPRPGRDGAPSNPARTRNLGRRRRNQGGHDDYPRTADASGGKPSPRRAGPYRGEAGHVADDPVAAKRRRQRALIDLRLADAAARRCEEDGRSIADEVRGVKAALFRQIFGADLSDDLIRALVYVDVQQRIIRLTRGGWVRDEGDTIYASGPDPLVVAVMVEAAKAKGWSSVRVWGSQEFIAEARRQFELAGIRVEAIDPPPAAKIEPAETPATAPADADEVVAQFQRWRANAEGRLTEIRRPAAPSAELVAARTTEKASEDKWRQAIRREEAARQTRNTARQDFAKSGFLSRKAARARLEAAQADLEALRAALRDAADDHDDAKAKAADLQRDHDHAERQRRADRAGEERRTQAEVIFATECARIAAESPDIAVFGREAVEAEARKRLAAPTARRAFADEFAGVDADISATTSKP